MITTHWDHQHFLESQTNMDHDLNAVKTLPNNNRRLRLYEWQEKGVTYGYKQQVPKELEQYSCGRRPTGGGIVFHNPGDIVFACAAPLDDPMFPGKLKEKMASFSKLFQKAFQECGVLLHPNPTPTETSGTEWREFCNTYPNPYELYCGDSKIVALTMRCYRKTFLVQGIVHLHDNNEHFSSVMQFEPFFSRGLDTDSRPSFTDLKGYFLGIV